LTETQLADTKLLPIEKLEQKLSEISIFDKIDMIDLYGGEVGLLPQQYIDDLKFLFKVYNIEDINIITNLSMVNDIIEDEQFYVTVSYDFDAREKHELVWKNMALLKKPYSVLVLASPKVLNMDVDYMIQSFNLIPNIVSVEVKPYSTNQANQLVTNFKHYEEFIKSWINSPVIKNFKFVNEDQIIASLHKQKNSFSDDHVYITPSGKYGVLEFDLNDNEFFLEYDTFEEYLDWCKKEKQRVERNKFCSNCQYYGNCLSEHLREVKNLDNSCNGFKLLLDWYNARLEN
jgi:hypothetical protein